MDASLMDILFSIEVVSFIGWLCLYLTTFIKMLECSCDSPTKSSLFKPCSKNFEPDLSNLWIESAPDSADADFVF